MLTASDQHRFSETLRRSVGALLSLQRTDGHWCGELQGDSILQSEYLLMKFILHQEHEPLADGCDGPKTLEKIARCLRFQQHDDGGWGQYPGAGVDLSATVKAYFALKLMGESPDSEMMQRARTIIRGSGGAECCNSFTNFYLACLGQISWDAVPAIPPEIIFLPQQFYFHLSKVSAWTRTMILPLSLVTSLRPTRQLSGNQGIDELYIDDTLRHRLSNTINAPTAWSIIFNRTDEILKTMHGFGGTPLRQRAIEAIETWMLQRAGQDGIACTDGLGAIFPPMVYLQIALKALGYTRDEHVIQRAERELDAFFIEEKDTIRIQPCFSPVWDTGIALYALTDCGMTIKDQPILKAAQWLISKECKHFGDFTANLDRGVVKNLQASGWYFEYHNAWYPDCDDTAMVAMALTRAGGDENKEAAQRGVHWLLAMQNDDGGWAAFDKTTHRPVLEYVPFADHNAMQDPSCPDITGRVLECLSWHGFSNRDAPVRRGIKYIRTKQEPEGCWFGRWGVNYIYGTWQAVIGPIRCGENREQDWIQQAGQWIKSIQKQDGSFGESPKSYNDPSLKGQGPSTASQTAWAAMVLQEIYGVEDDCLKRAIQWLSQTQLTEVQAKNPGVNPDNDPPGSWSEPWFTGTGFPKVFYLRYHLYRLYYPVMAIGRYLIGCGLNPCERMEPQMHADEHRCDVVS